MDSRYSSYLQSTHWKQVRSRILKRAKGLCEKCGAPAASPDVHHKTYVRLGKERDADLIALCTRCHQKEHPDKQILQRASFVGEHACNMCPCELAEIFVGDREVIYLCVDCGDMAQRPKKKGAKRRSRKQPKAAPLTKTERQRKRWDAIQARHDAAVRADGERRKACEIMKEGGPSKHRRAALLSRLAPSAAPASTARPTSTRAPTASRPTAPGSWARHSRRGRLVLRGGGVARPVGMRHLWLTWGIVLVLVGHRSVSSVESFASETDVSQPTGTCARVARSVRQDSPATASALSPSPHPSNAHWAINSRSRICQRWSVCGWRLTQNSFGGIG